MAGVKTYFWVNQLCLARVHRYKLQCYAIIAPALTGGFRTIIEHMALMPTTADTMILGSWPNHFIILFGR